MESRLIRAETCTWLITGERFTKFRLTAARQSTDRTQGFRRPYDRGSAGQPATGLAFTKDGHLYLAHQPTGSTLGNVTELSTSTLSIVRTLNPAIPGGNGLAVDPLHGDLFLSGTDGNVYRISNFSNGLGDVSVYATVNSLGQSVDGIVFGPDGTLYGADNANGVIYTFPNTNQPFNGPWTGTPLASVVVLNNSMNTNCGGPSEISGAPGTPAPIDGIGLGASSTPGTPPFIYVNRNDGVISKVDFSTTPPTETDIVACGTRGDFVAVDSHGCLFATQSSSVVKVADASGNCNPPLVPTPTGNGAGPRTVVFVHGINGNFRTYGPNGGQWSQLFDSLVARYGQNNVVIEPYFQDKGYAVNGSCSGMPTPDQRKDQLFLDPNIGSTCDSKGVLAYTSTQLDDDLNGMTAPVAVIANSMGGAITRGWMTLAQCQTLPGCASTRSTDHTLSIVDTVVFVQAVHQGSYLATNGEALLGSNLPTDNPVAFREAKLAISFFGIDPSRPGIADVAGDSSWYRSVNPTAVPKLHYYNIYTDITVNVLSNLISRVLPPISPFDAGDTVILPGTPTPTDHRLLGGARFNPCTANAPDCHEFGLAKTVTIPLWQAILGQDANSLALYATDPYAHANFGNHLNDGQIFMKSCASQASATPTQEILRVLSNPANACS